MIAYDLFLHIKSLSKISKKLCHIERKVDFLDKIRSCGGQHIGIL